MSENHLVKNFKTYLIFILCTALGFSIVFLAQIRFDVFEEISVAIFVITACAMVLRPVFGLYLFVYFAILSDTHYLYEFEGFNSIYTVKFMGVSLIDILLLILVGSTVLRAFMTGKVRAKINHWDKSFLTLFCLISCAAPYGLLFAPDFGYWVVEMKLFTYFVVPYILVRFWLNSAPKLLRLFDIIFLTLSAKLLVYTALYFAKFGDIGPSLVRVSLSTDNVFYALILLFAVGVLFLKLPMRIKFVFSLLALLSFFMIVFTFGREIWVVSGLAIVLFFFFVQRHHRIKLVLVSGATVCLSIVIAAIFYPSQFEYLGYNIKTFSMKTETIDGEISGAVRTIEWINVINLLWEKNAIWQGRGIGATWTDRYFPLPKKRDPFSFPTDEVEHGFTHMISSMLLLKFGLIGSAVFWFALLWSWAKSLKLALGLSDFKRYFLLALVLGCISVLAKLTLVRVALVGSLIIGIISNYIMLYEDKSHSHSI